MIDSNGLRSMIKKLDCDECAALFPALYCYCDRCFDKVLGDRLRGSVCESVVTEYIRERGYDN